ncbi:hypothetical protein BDZ91DRAFT_129301 [Kalaharituber pfeilii]|nr:hypothetical protein BDZ91DRAFT_129301 [Kalaharituber pfeilii]
MCCGTITRLQQYNNMCCDKVSITTKCCWIRTMHVYIPRERLGKEVGNEHVWTAGK